MLIKSIWDPNQLLHYSGVTPQENFGNSLGKKKKITVLLTYFWYFQHQPYFKNTFSFVLVTTNQLNEAIQYESKAQHCKETNRTTFQRLLKCHEIDTYTETPVFLRFSHYKNSL